MIRRRVLDLCCGAGGAGRGYAEAGYEVTGVDIRPQPNYPYRFVLADAIDHLADLIDTGEIERYDLVHTSWPCQTFARVTAWRGNRDSHPDLLTPGRELLERCGRPWVMENVPEAPIRPDYLLCGSMFGLNIRRHRAFETSWGGGGQLLPPCWHHPRLLPFAHKGERAYADAMGCTWMTNREARQAIPPAYTRWIGETVHSHLPETTLR
ncbi:DNA cytosine methyltransferase [Streptomyces sp. ST2-7A]|uniref:DNA cytosine methyltransferase n=1 Tax=Streptomyces sp. ST2-7A TaxID=2907214 RepID=UPI001F1BFFDB|nr:DNA cytosine methyltransferase [Streptomyces sp. ST2-7A]MCE7080442.1 DNA cytosine methyltransferase [Streptomyces sp. ST2-7A]